MNYLVIRDDFGGYTGRTPFFQYWSLSEDAALAGGTAAAAGANTVTAQPLPGLK